MKISTFSTFKKRIPWKLFAEILETYIYRTELHPTKPNASKTKGSNCEKIQYKVIKIKCFLNQTALLKVG